MTQKYVDYKRELNRKKYKYCTKCNKTAKYFLAERNSPILKQYCEDHAKILLGHSPEE